MAESPGKWRQLKSLKGWQWKVLLASPFMLFLTWLRLRSGGYGKTLAAAQAAVETRLAADEALALARDTSYAMAVAIKYGPWRPKCLVRSLALGWFLGRKGIPFEVRIGVRDGQSMIGSDGKLDFTAHAWVEFDGVVLNDKEDVAEDYRPFSSGSSFSRDDAGDRG